MKRNVRLEEISDGRLYGENDMVRADCHGCEGCSGCCTDMGNSVILDPFDIYRIQTGYGKPLSELLAEEAVEWNVVDGIILPNMKMAGSKKQCAFLDEKGRCGIYPYRPGVCRLFPLGRYYESGDFRYFLQTKECTRANRSKVKAAKWIDTPDTDRYHAFVREWHYFLNGQEEALAGTEDMERAKALNLLLLRTFYLEPFDACRDFYPQFFERIRYFRENLL